MSSHENVYIRGPELSHRVQAPTSGFITYMSPPSSPPCSYTFPSLFPKRQHFPASLSFYFLRSLKSLKNYLNHWYYEHLHCYETDPRTFSSCKTEAPSPLNNDPPSPSHSPQLLATPIPLNVSVNLTAQASHTSGVLFVFLCLAYIV